MRLVHAMSIKNCLESDMAVAEVDNMEGLLENQRSKEVLEKAEYKTA